MLTHSKVRHDTTLYGVVCNTPLLDEGWTPSSYPHLVLQRRVKSRVEIERVIGLHWGYINLWVLGILKKIILSNNDKWTRVMSAERAELVQQKVHLPRIIFIFVPAILHQDHLPCGCHWLLILQKTVYNDFDLIFLYKNDKNVKLHLLRCIRRVFDQLLWILILPGWICSM